MRPIVLTQGTFSLQLRPRNPTRQSPCSFCHAISLQLFPRGLPSSRTNDGGVLSVDYETPVVKVPSSADYDLEPPDDFFCHISKTLFERPVCIATGHSVERKSIREYWETQGEPKHHVTGEVLSFSSGPPQRSHLSRSSRCFFCHPYTCVENIFDTSWCRKH